MTSQRHVIRLIQLSRAQIEDIADALNYRAQHYECIAKEAEDISQVNARHIWRASANDRRNLTLQLFEQLEGAEKRAAEKMTLGGPTTPAVA